MFKQTDTKRVLFVHTLRRSLLGLFVFLSLGGMFAGIFAQSTPVAAATNNTINFQARLLGGAGNVAPDGNYNVEFKIYNAQSSSGSSQGACTGDAACLWSETRTSSNRVRVANGYMSVTLGSVAAFPGNLDWSQDLWLTMNIGGSGVSASWDGEMNPRLHLTAVPYAMSAATAVRAGTADILQNNGANASTLGWASQTSTRSILLPDASGTVCLAGTEGCGFAINGGNTTGSAFTVGTNDNYGLNLEVNNTTVASFTNTGAATFKNASNSTAAFDIQNTGSGSLFKVNTTDNVITIGSGANTDFTIANNGENKAWQTNANALTEDLAGHTTVTANGYVYVLGGDASSGTQSAVYYAKLNSDGSTSSWTTSSNPLPAAREGATATVANGYIYVAGGYNAPGGSGAQSTVYYAKLNLDGSTSSWTTSSNPLPAARAVASSITANGYMYVMGGAAGSQYDTVYYAKLNSDGSTSSWTTSSNPLPNTSAYGYAATANGYVYVVRGVNQDDVYYAKLNSDGSTSSWTAGPYMPASRISMSAVAANGYLYVMGGALSSTPQSTVYYAKLDADGAIGSWLTSANALPNVRTNAKSITANGFIYVIGGAGSSGRTDTVYYSKLQTTNVNGSAIFAGSVAGAEAQNTNEFTTLGQVEKLMVGAVNTLSSSALINGGNSFGGALAIGTNDNYGMNFEVNNTTVASFTNTGAATFKNASNSTAAFDIQNVTGDSMLKVDTTNSSVVVGGILQLTGDVTANRPGSPTDGMLYYDTDTKRLLVYSNGKWQADRSDMILVASSFSTQAYKDAADFVADGTADQDTIADAIDALTGGFGGTVYLLPGLYQFSAPLVIDETAEVTVKGGGGAYNAIIARNFENGPLIDVESSGVTISGLGIDGNKYNGYSNAGNHGIYKASDIAGLILENNRISDNAGRAIYLEGDTGVVDASIIRSNRIANSTYGIYALHGRSLQITNNSIASIDNHAISLEYTNQSIVSGNVVRNASGSGVYLGEGENNTISGNTISGNNKGLSGGSWGMTVTGNSFSDNTDAGLELGGFITGISVSANTIQANGDGIRIQPGVNQLVISSNKISWNDGYGIGADVATSISGATISSNVISENGGQGIVLINQVYDTSISGNSIVDNGGSGAYSSIEMNGASGNSITGNTIRDSSGTGYAIAIGSGASNTYLADNTFGGAGASSISDASNSTVYANQMQSESGDFLIRPGQDSVAAFRVQNANGEDLLLVDTTSNKLTLGNGGTDVTISNTGANRSWGTESDTLPANRQGAATVVANGYIYAIGGDNGSAAQSTVYYAKLNADGSTESWSTNANALPAARSLGSAVVVGGYVYYIGGVSVVPYAGAQSTVYYAKLNADGSTGSWSTTTALATAKRVPNVATANGYIYVMGGVTSGDTNTDTVHRVKVNADGTLGSWITSGNLSSVRSGASALVHNNRIYLAGGFDPGDVKSSVDSAAINSDGTLATWSEVASMPDKASSPVGAVVGGYIYISGGFDSGVASSDTYYARINSDGTLQSWEVSANPLPSARYYGGRGGSVAYNGYMYVVGGANSSNAATNTVFYAALQRTSIEGSTQFAGSVSGADAVNSNEFLTLGQASLLVGNAVGIATSNALLQGGNSFGTAMTLGTNDNYGINFEVNGGNVFTLSNTGAALLQNSTNSTSAFVVRNASGTTDVLIVDTATPGVTVNGSFTVNNLTGQSQTVRPGVDSLSDPQFKVQSSTGNNAFTVGTSSTLTQVGIGLGGTNVPTMAGNGLEVKGSIRISGTGADNVDTFTTPQGSSVTTRINVGLYDPGNFNQIVAMGLPSGASTSSRVLSIFDNRSGSNNQTPLAIFSPNESQVLGLGWDGQSTRGFLKTTSSELGFKIGSTSIGAFTSAGFDVAGGIAAATNSTTAFNVQNGSNQSLLLVDTTNSRITVGSGTATTLRIGDATNNTTFSSSTGNYELNGTARRTRTIMLQPEYTGAILDASSDATCSSANSGTLTSSVDLTNRKNYYNWMSTSGSAQCYNVIVQVPIPQDFSAWSSSTPLKVFARTSNTSNGTANIELRDSTGSVIYNYVSVTPGSTNTWSQTTVGTSISGTYTAGDFMTLRIRVSSNSSANIQLGVISMDYLSKW